MSSSFSCKMLAVRAGSSESHALPVRSKSAPMTSNLIAWVAVGLKQSAGRITANTATCHVFTLAIAGVTDLRRGAAHLQTILARIDGHEEMAMSHCDRHQYSIYKIIPSPVLGHHLLDAYGDTV
jgi:hypothetical protein